MPFGETVNTRIKKCRKDKKITQQEMAKLLKLKRTTYAYMENNGEPNREMISKIAKILGVSDYYLWHGENTAPTELSTIEPVSHSFSMGTASYPYKVNSFTATKREQKLIEMLRLLPKDKRDEMFKEIEVLYNGKEKK